jgi:Uma2 family endonuclease
MPGLGPTTKIEVQGRIRYPDAHVNCTKSAPGDTIVPEPVVVFEVLSPNTSRTDRIEKLQEYQATESIQRYIILEPDSIAATVFSRMGADLDRAGPHGRGRTSDARDRHRAATERNLRGHGIRSP